MRTKPEPKRSKPKMTKRNHTLTQERKQRRGGKQISLGSKTARPLILCSVMTDTEGRWRLFPHQWANTAKPFKPSKRTTTWWCCLNNQPHGLVLESDLDN